MIYNMLYIKLDLTLMISEAIGRFFPDQIVQSRDSKIKKEESMHLDISISNT